MGRRISFTARILLTLSLTVLVAVAAVTILSRTAAQQHFDSYITSETRPQMLALLPALGAHYIQVGSWAGVGEVLGDWGPGQGWMRGMGRGCMTGIGALLTDAERRVVFDPTGRYLGQRLSRTTVRRGIDITLDGLTIGYLLPTDGPQEEEFARRLTITAVWAGALAVAMALVVGLLLTRAVTRPLQALRAAAQRIGAGDLASRVPVTSHDEIGELAGQFNEMAASLEHDHALRRRMMADIAHELRTPLAVIRAQIEALQDGVFGLTVDNLTPLHDQTLLLGRLVNDLRDLALAEAGQLALERTPLDVAALASRAVNAFMPRAQERGVMLHTDLPDDLPTLVADGQRLEQVLGNLLTNALRHTPGGGSVTVSARVEGDALALVVADTGSGIASEELEHLFDREYRAQRAREGGAGLGLAIVRQLVEAHGGRVEVASVEGQGTTVTAYLPIESKSGR